MNAKILSVLGVMALMVAAWFFYKEDVKVKPAVPQAPEATYEVLEKQLRLLEQFASDVGFEHHELPKLLIAYEPVWAIGTGLTPTTLEIEEVHNYISESLSTLEIYAPLLYGGSVNQNNASDIANIAGVDGVLVGGASLKADNFGQIIRAFIN